MLVCVCIPVHTYTLVYIWSFDLYIYIHICFFSFRYMLLQYLFQCETIFFFFWREIYIEGRYSPNCCHHYQISETNNNHLLIYSFISLSHYINFINCTVKDNHNYYFQTVSQHDTCSYSWFQILIKTFQQRSLTSLIYCFKLWCEEK